MLEVLFCALSAAIAAGLTVFLSRVWVRPALRWTVLPLGAVGTAYLVLSAMVWIEGPPQNTGAVHVDGLHEIPGELGTAVFGGFLAMLRGTAAALLSLIAFAAGILVTNIYLERGARS